MKIKLLLFFAIFLCPFVDGLPGVSSPMSPINNLFDAMREKDAAKIMLQFTDDARLQRAQADGTIVENDITKFSERIAASKSYLDEQLFGVKLFKEGSLATAWTPFVFYIDGSLSHCGVNTFQLVRRQEQWKIQSIIDVQHQGDCVEFEQSHKNL